MKMLVTGGAGFIGSHVAEWLIKDGHEVVVLDDMSGGSIDNVPMDALYTVQGSITDHLLVKYLFEQEKFDHVFHLAAYAAEGLSHFIRRYNYMNNVVGSMNLINAAVKYGVKCFVFTSSIAVYGSGRLPLRETMHPQPEDPYGIAKYAVEMDLKAARHQFGLEYIIFRPHNVFGPRQNIGDRYRNVIGIFMNQLLQGQPMTVFGDGCQTRAFSYIDDVAPIIARSVQHKKAYHQIFNVGGDVAYSVNVLAEQVATAMGINLIPSPYVQSEHIKYLPARNEVQHAYADHRKVKRVFGVGNSTPLDIGLAKMAAWVNQVGARKTPAFQGIEIEKGLPEVWR